MTRAREPTLLAAMDGGQDRQSEDSTGSSVATLVGMPTSSGLLANTANTSRIMSVPVSRKGCEAADECCPDMIQDSRRSFGRLSREMAEQAAVTKRRHTLSTHAGARNPCTACAASSTDYVTCAVSCSSRLDRDAVRQQTGATDTSGPALAFLGALPPPHPTLSSPPSSPLLDHLSCGSPATSPSSCPELHGEAARWSSDLLSVIRAMVQQEVGRTDHPPEDLTTGRQLDSPLFVTPYPAASSVAAVVPEVMDPGGSTSDRAALRSSPSLSMSRAPFSFPAVDSPSSYSSISLSSSPMASPTAPHAVHTDQSAAMLPPRRDTADIRSPRSTADFSSARKPSPLPDMPTERRSSVHFRDPLVSGRASAGGSRSGSRSTQSEGRTTAADVVTTDRSIELSPVDKKWGVLFDERGEATGRFDEVMHSLAKYIVEHLLPAGHIVIVPEKLASFYNISRLDKEAVLYSAMLQTPSKDLYRRLSDLYENLGCSYHLVQARLATRPSVPALTPDGFARWMVLHAQAFPDEEACRLDRLVSMSPLETRSQLDGKPERLPKQLSRHLLPRAPVASIREQLQQAVKRHFGDIYLARPTAATTATSHRHSSRHLSLPLPLEYPQKEAPTSRGIVSVSASRGRLPPVVHQDRGSGDGQEAERRRRRRRSQADNTGRSTPARSQHASPQPSRTRFRTSYADVHHVTAGSGNNSNSNSNSHSRRVTYYECVPQSHKAGHAANNTRQSRMSEAVEAVPSGTQPSIATSHASTRANMRKPVDGGNSGGGGGGSSSSRRTMGIDSGGRRTRGEGGGHIAQTWDDFLQRFR